MAKDKKKKQKEEGGRRIYEPPQPVISRRGWKIIGMGVVLVVLGFIVLTFTDPRGQNFASDISPFLIIGGYATIGFGIVAKDKEKDPA